MDFILNGSGHGDVASTLLANGFDIGALRPYMNERGTPSITITRNGKLEMVPALNAKTTLRKDDWLAIDRAVVKAAKPRLRAVGDLRSAGLVHNIPNGMAKTVLETTTQSDITAADLSMDGLRQSQSDRPEFETSNLPLPIAHKDFEFSARQIQASRNDGSPLDTTTAELAGRRVAEIVEGLTTGTLSTYTYGGGTIYGYTNLVGRMTATIAAPSASGWAPADTLTNVLAMRQQSRAAFHYGPWMLYCSSAFDQYMEEDFKANGDLTLRERLAKIEDIQDVRTLDTLTGFTLLLVQMTSDVARIVTGMDITTVQWESQGGMQVNFKVLAILVPQLRLDQNSNGGIVHGSV